MNEKRLDHLTEQFGEMFGFKIRDDEKEENKKLLTFAEPEKNDGALITGYSQADFNATNINFSEYSLRNENDLIEKYRDMAFSPDVETVVDDIIHEMIVSNAEETEQVKLVLDDVNVSDSTKKKVLKEWDDILEMFEFKDSGYEIARRWFVDGRSYYHLMIDMNNPKEGIKEVRYIDPRKIRKIREAKMDEQEKMFPKYNNVLQPPYDEYFLFSDKGMDDKINPKGIRIEADSIAYAHSGLIDHRSGLVLSYLHKAIKPYNQLRMLEDATVIYTIARAPERRLFYIDIAGLPPQVGEKYMEAVIQRYKNKLSYDVNTGDIVNERRYTTMLQDFFLPQGENGGTRIDTLPGGEKFQDMDNVEYFRRKLFRSLFIPESRMEDNATFNLGRTSEINRDEVKFNKFIRRLRMRFIVLLEQTLYRQLILKNIISVNDWPDIKKKIRYDFVKDNLFSELKELELWRERTALLRDIEEYAHPDRGGYFSKKWIQRNVLRMNDQEIEQIDKQIKDEEKSGEGLEDFYQDEPPQATGQQNRPGQGTSPGNSPFKPTKPKPVSNSGNV